VIYDLACEQRPEPSARLLDQWVRDAQSLTGGADKRIGWMLASTVVIAALQRALGSDQQPLFLVKGGLYLELKLGLGARATQDVDTLFRGSAREFEESVNKALAEPWGPFALLPTKLERIPKAPRQIKPYRFDVLLVIRGATWRRVRVEVSFPEGDINSHTASVPAPSLGFFGIDSPSEIIAIAMDYQIAQKMHAASDPDVPPDIINERVRDIVDLVLLREHFYRDGSPSSLSSACLDVFNARATEVIAIDRTPRNWPPAFVANATWKKTFPKLAESVDMTYSLDQAIGIVEDWVSEITARS
jgi:hypothetical protein